MTGKRPHCVLHCPLPPFRRFHHSILAQHCSLSENRILPNAFGSLPGNGHFSPLTNPEIQDSMAMQRCKVWRVLWMNYHCILRLEPFFPGQKDKRVLSPYPQDMCLLLTNSRLFPLDGTFTGSNWEPYLLLVTWWFPQELPLRDSLLIPPQDTITSDGWRPPFTEPAAAGTLFAPCLLSHLILKYQPFTAPPKLSSEGFPYISVEKRFWKCDRPGSPTTLLTFCGTQVSKWLTEP